MGRKEIEEVEVLAVKTGLKEGSLKMRKICMCLYTDGKNLVKETKTSKGRGSVMTEV